MVRSFIVRISPDWIALDRPFGGQQYGMLTKKRDTMMVAKTLTPAMKYAYTHRKVVDVSGPKRHVLQPQTPATLIVSCRAFCSRIA